MLRFTWFLEMSSAAHLFSYTRFLQWKLCRLLLWIIVLNKKAGQIFNKGVKELCDLLSALIVSIYSN